MKKFAPRGYLSELENPRVDYFEKPEVLREFERVKNEKKIVYTNEKYEQV